MGTRSPTTSSNRTSGSARLVEAALAWRTDPPSDQTTLVGLLREQLVPLYIDYIDDHIRRLREMGRGDLAAAFEQWREQLLA